MYPIVPISRAEKRCSAEISETSADAGKQCESSSALAKERESRQDTSWHVCTLERAEVALFGAGGQAI